MGMVLAAAMVAGVLAAVSGGADSGRGAEGPAASAPASQPAAPPEAVLPWSEMTRFFSPPPEYEGRLGSHRSVMTLDDGTPVKTAADWSRRRSEVRAYWHGVMGPWPALLDRPRIEFIAAEHVENFTRHRIRLEVAADRFMADQYLLVPDGAGPFPAVLVTWCNAADSAGLTAKQRGIVDFGRQLARCGFVTLCLGNTGGADVRDPRTRAASSSLTSSRPPPGATS
jgi:hypothetical protein